MAADPSPETGRTNFVDNVNEVPNARLPRISVTLSGAMAHALAADADRRMIPVAEVVRQAIAFDIAARERAATALVDAIAERGAAARRLAQILATPATDRMGRRLDAVARASRHARAARNSKGKPTA